MASAPSAPVAMPAPVPQAAYRREVPLADGSSVAQQLIAADDTVAFQFVRTLQEALMGKVKSAVVCMRVGGNFVAPPSGAPQTLVAIKQLLKSCVRERRTRAGKPVQEDPLREVAVLRALQVSPGVGSEHVMRLLAFLEDEKYYFIVYEFLDSGELFAQVQATGKVPEARAARHFFDTLLGARFCHAHAVSHRDLSLENVMLHTGSAAAAAASLAPAYVPTAKIIDFGLAVMMPPAGGLLLWDGRVGKERYMAPETYAGLPYDGRAIDVWCLGMMLFVMLFGVYPYASPSPALCPYFQQIADGNLLPMLRGWGYDQHVSADALHLIDRMLTVDPHKRATTDEILAHPWLRAECERAAAESGGGRSPLPSIDDGSFYN